MATTTKKTTTKPKEESVKKGGMEGRNPDGTFAKGSKPKITSNYGAPLKNFSYKAMAKVRASKDPNRVLKDLEALDAILDNESTSPMERMKALELKIKLNGGFDPQETTATITGEVAAEINKRPYKGLTIDEIRKALGKK